jgi:ABC-type phosphate transport system substrate-binding protein
MRIVAITVLALTLVPGGFSGSQTHALSASAFQVICHPSNPMTTVDREFLEDAFLKRTKSWPSDGEIRPVDLALNAPVRRFFSKAVLKRSPEAVRNYWQQAIFAGRELPPPELDSDGDVVKYVLRHPGAVGYVFAGAALGGAKVLIVR